MRPYILYISFFLISSYTAAQSSFESNSFIDVRDGQEYSLVEVGGRIWMGENLKYISENAFFKEKEQIKAHGNYYSYEESNKVCPQGWELTSLDDWVAYSSAIFLLLTERKAKDKNMGKQERGGFAYYITNNYYGKDRINFMTNGHYNFFGKKDTLNLLPAGRVEGGIEISADSFVDYWTKPLKKKSLYFHLHITKNIFSGHAHRHHIAPKAKKKRLFKVRCVKSN